MQSKELASMVQSLLKTGELQERHRQQLRQFRADFRREVEPLTDKHCQNQRRADEAWFRPAHIFLAAVQV